MRHSDPAPRNRPQSGHEGEAADPNTTVVATAQLSISVDPCEYDLGDSAATVRTAPRRWGWATDGLDGLPAAAEAALEALVSALRAAGGVGTSLHDVCDAVWRNLAGLAETRGVRTRVVDVLGGDHPLLIATIECDRMLSVAARAVAAEVGRADEGVLQRIGVSDGGAPKESAARAEVGPRGLAGDRQAEREHHGRPFQAVSLYSAELIDTLSGEGHPIAPGAVGENLLLSGLDWGSLRPGVRLVIGRDDPGEGVVDGETRATIQDADRPVVLEVNAWVPPCRTIAPAFTDRRFDRIDHDKHPGWSRAYAWVLRGGTVVTGSRVEALP